MDRMPRWAVIAILLAVLAAVAWWMREEIGAVALLWEEDKPSPIRVERDQANRLFERAYALFEGKRFEEARPLYQEAAVLYERVIDYDNQAAVLENLGMVEQNLGRYPEAAAYYRQALEIYDRMREHRRSALTNERLGNASRAMDRNEDARQFYARARALLDPGKDQKVLARIALYQGVTEDRMRALDAAADFYSEAAALATEADDPFLLGQIAHAMARVELQRDRLAEARELLENALLQYGSVGATEAQARAREDLAQIDSTIRRGAEQRK
jgi:tetratricopeptide (TPR) repeat protein